MNKSFFQWIVAAFVVVILAAVTVNAISLERSVRQTNGQVTQLVAAVKDLQGKEMVAEKNPAKTNPTTPVVNTTEPLLFTNNSNLFTVSKSEKQFLSVFNSVDLQSMSEECGTSYDDAYFKKLLSKYSSSAALVTYTFTYKGASQQPNTWSLSVAPNSAGIKSMDELKKNFDQCFAGGDRYPLQVSEKYLVFESGCGTGFSDGSDKPIGCDQIRDVVKPTVNIR